MRTVRRPVRSPSTDAVDSDVMEAEALSRRKFRGAVGTYPPCWASQQGHPQRFAVTRRYQLAFFTPGIRPSRAMSRNTRRDTWNLR